MFLRRFLQQIHFPLYKLLPTVGGSSFHIIHSAPKSILEGYSYFSGAGPDDHLHPFLACLFLELNPSLLTKCFTCRKRLMSEAVSPKSRSMAASFKPALEISRATA